MKAPRIVLAFAIIVAFLGGTAATLQSQSPFSAGERYWLVFAAARNTGCAFQVVEVRGEWIKLEGLRFDSDEVRTVSHSFASCLVGASDVPGGLPPSASENTRPFGAAIFPTLGVEPDWINTRELIGFRTLEGN